MTYGSRAALAVAVEVLIGLPFFVIAVYQIRTGQPFHSPDTSNYVSFISEFSPEIGGLLAVVIGCCVFYFAWTLLRRVIARDAFLRVNETGVGWSEEPDWRSIAWKDIESIGIKGRVISIKGHAMDEAFEEEIFIPVHVAGRRQIRKLRDWLQNHHPAPLADEKMLSSPA
jgi:hypothetical protein